MFQLPNVFAMLPRSNAVPRVIPADTRPVETALSQPIFNIYNPDDLHYVDKTVPVVPGNENVTLGLGMVAVPDNSLWDRHAVSDAGPVREFFARMNNSRVRHT